MCGICKRRQRAMAKQPPSKQPPAGEGPNHKSALKAVRKKFAESWRACGEAKETAAQSHANASIEDHWARTRRTKNTRHRDPVGEKPRFRKTQENQERHKN